MRPEEVDKEILEAFKKSKSGKWQAGRLAKKLSLPKEELEGRLKVLEKEGFVCKKGGWWSLKSRISPVDRAKVSGEGLATAIEEAKESLLKALKDLEKRLLEEMGKLKKEFSRPSLKDFEEAILDEYPRLHVDYLNAVVIPELRRSIKIKLGMDDDTFDEFLIKLVEGNSNYKLEEGSGEEGLRHRGRNYIFLKLSR